MPEMHFLIEWPDGQRDTCYSPSYVIEEHLSVGASYETRDFMRRATAALNLAAERVRERYGFVCTSALEQLAALEAKADSLTPEYKAGSVMILTFEKHAPRDARADAPRPASGAVPLTYPVIVVGAGQAGLSVSYWLKNAGIEHLILEKSRIGHSWRTQRWDSFCLVTPNWQCQLPGYPYAGADPEGFMTNREIIDYLGGYVRSFDPPVREGVNVLCVERSGPAAFTVTTSAGVYSAGQVVVATGGYHVARVPPVSRRLPEDVVQLHSAAYRNPASLPPGDVLVVGTGQSGCQIAEDLFLAGRGVHLSVGPAPRCARRYRGRDVVEWLHLMGHYDMPIDEHPSKEVARDKTNHYVTGRDGGHDIDLRQFALGGMRLYGPLEDIVDERITFSAGLKKNLDDADDVYRRINRSIDAYIEKAKIDSPPGSEYAPPWEPKRETLSLDWRRAGIRSVVWCIGFAMDFGWVKLPVFDARGYPLHDRGVSPEAGLYFIGLPWLYTWGSGRFCGVGRDAKYIVDRIERGLRYVPGVSASA
jgi:putative flavoprotein involved in K+ transport